jgi:hypothetical protein
VGVTLLAIGKAMEKGDAGDLTEDSLDFRYLLDDPFSADSGELGSRSEAPWLRVRAANVAFLVRAAPTRALRDAE